MKIEERELKTIQGEKVVQITTLDERWYKDKDDLYRPSSSWIASYYPVSQQLIEWIAKTGLDESRKIRDDAGVRGSKIHQIIDDILNGKKVKMDEKYLNNKTGEMENITPDEWYAVMTFRDFWKESGLVLEQNEYTVIKEICEGEDPDYINRGYGGTIDIRVRDAKAFLSDVRDKRWILDIKTSKSISPEHELQISSYKHAHDNYEELGMGIIQVAYKLNKKGYKFTEIEDQYDLFISAKKFWKKENKNIQPSQRDYPFEISLS